MPKKKYHVTLSAEERMTIEQLLWQGKAGTRRLTRARILLQVVNALKCKQLLPLNMSTCPQS